MSFFHVFEIIFRRDNIWDHVPVPYSVSFGSHLTFIKVPFPVPLPGEIVLVLSPRDTCHEMRDITVVPP